MGRVPRESGGNMRVNVNSTAVPTAVSSVVLNQLVCSQRAKTGGLNNGQSECEYHNRRNYPHIWAATRPDRLADRRSLVSAAAHGMTRALAMACSARTPCAAPPPRLSEPRAAALSLHAHTKRSNPLGACRSEDGRTSGADAGLRSAHTSATAPPPRIRLLLHASPFLARLASAAVAGRLPSRRSVGVARWRRAAALPVLSVLPALSALPVPCRI